MVNPIPQRLSHPATTTLLLLVTSLCLCGASALAQQDDEARVQRHATPQLDWQQQRHLRDQILRSEPQINQPLVRSDSRDAPVFDVWSGLDQTFGEIGTPQNWVNILGTVAATDSVASLVYSLNGGPELPLSVGPDQRRLAEPGDFNVDLHIDDLVEGLNQVVITATDTLGVQTVETVNVDFTMANVWPLPYSIDWDTVTDVTDVAQVVDGKWDVIGGGLRTTQVDYDRVIDIGDMTWENYEVTTTITLHGIEEGGPYSGNSGGFGFVSRWTGHTDIPDPGWQPKVGWLPSGGSSYYAVAYQRLMIDDEYDNSVPVEIGDTINWKFRAETAPNLGGRYSVKIWHVGDAEPETWNVVSQRGPDDEPAGSLVFYAHHTDVTLGDLTITEIPMSIGPAQVLQLSDTSVEVSWESTAPADSRVDYGLDSSYGFTEFDPALVTDHSVVLTGLTPNTEYHFQVTSVDAGFFEAQSEDRVFDTTLATVVSDDFNACELDDGLWTAHNPLGDSSIFLDGSRVQIDLPGGGDAHSCWGSGPDDFFNTLPRLMQPVADTDFQIEVKFESGLDTPWQNQGVLIEQDVNDVLLVEFVRNNYNDTRIQALKIENGDGSNLGDWGVPIADSGFAPLYLRINRNDDVWTISTSVDDGDSWQIYKVFTHAMAVSSIGPFAGNGGNPVPPVTATVDYFFNATSPVDPEDPVAHNAPVLEAIGDRFMLPEQSLVVPVSATDDDLDPIVLTAEDVPSFAAFTDFGDGTGELELNPGPDDGGDYVITITATDSPCGLFDSETFTVHVGTGTPSILVSDDFNACELDTDLWTFVNPLGDGTARVNGYQAELFVPAGTVHDLWGNGPGDFEDTMIRLMQPANDVDFEIEARFESSLDTPWQMQGMIIEQDANDLLRLEFLLGDSGETNIVIYKIEEGDGSNIGGWGLPIGPAGLAPLSMRVQRFDDLWTVLYSLNDGADWTVYQTFVHSMTVTSAGVHCGNAGSPVPAHTARIDYFFNLLSPIVPEDPIVHNAPELAFIGDQTLDEGASLDVGVSATDADLEAITLTADNLPGFAGFTDFGDGTGELVLNPQAGDAGDYPITITATDPCGLYDAETFTVHVGSFTPSSLVSDDFNSCTLDTDLWTFVNPLDDAAVHADGYRAVVNVPGDAVHDLWGNGPEDFEDTMVRLMQPANDVDFEVVARFESILDTPWQMQGLMVAQDENDLLRLEFLLNDSGQINIAAFKIVEGDGIAIGGYGTPIAAPGTSPLLLRVARNGHDWTVSYSLDDGDNWPVYQTFNHVLAVGAVGVHFGNAGNPIPAFTGQVDYFFNEASPIDPEDPDVYNAPVITEIDDQQMLEGDSSIVAVSADDADEDPITLAATGLPGFAGFTDLGAGAGELSLDPQPGDTGEYTITITATDPCGLFDTEFVTVTVGEPSSTVVRSDDFNCHNLDTGTWTFFNPLGDATVMLNGTQVVVELPAGTVHDVWGTGPGDFVDTMVRLEQTVDNVDFGIEASFDSVADTPWQMQGIMIGQDEDDMLRVELILNDTNEINIAVFRIANGVGGSIAGWGVPIADPGTSPLQMRVERYGNNWVVWYSVDGGANWVNHLNFSHTMTVATVGLHFGNGGDPVPAFTGIVDWFFDLTAPIVPEDGLPLNSPQLVQIADQNMSELHTLIVDVAATDADEDPITLSVEGLPAFGTFTDNGDGTGSLEFAPQLGDAGDYPLTVVASDPCAIPAAESFTLSVSAAQVAAIVSDDFNACTLAGSLWDYTDPLGDTGQMLTGAQLLLAVSPDTTHVLAGTGSADFVNDYARVTQLVENGDFELDVRFESGLDQLGQIQGVLIEQDAENLLAMELGVDGAAQTTLRVRTFADGAGSLVGGSGAAIAAAGAAPLQIRVNRTGDDWTVSYSIDDGNSWPVYQAFSHVLTVAEVGIVAGNETEPAPGHSTIVDYFFNTASPIDPEDAVPCAVPDPVTDLVAAQVLTNNDADGTTKIELSWSAVSCAASVDVYRKGFGTYPDYTGGSVPEAPADPAQALADGWELAAAVPATDVDFQDEVTSRNFWYYVAMVVNGCGDVSAVSNLTTGTLNYLLGDVADGTTPGSGDNLVDGEDVAVLSASYGLAAGNPSFLDYLDFGPTANSLVTGRPIPDELIEFEDLILMTINHELDPAAPEPLPRGNDMLPPETNELVVRVATVPPVGQTFTVELHLVANGEIQGLSVPLQWDDQVVEPIETTTGEFVDQQSVAGLLLVPQLGTVDAALLGPAAEGFYGYGTLATLTFEVIGAGDPGIGLGAIRARDLNNADVAIEEAVVTGVAELSDLPQVTVLHQNMPNPFNPRTTIAFDLAEAGRVRVRIFSIDGALVRTLVDEEFAAGRYQKIWDGKDRSGRGVASGAYFFRLETPTSVQNKRMMLIR